MVIRASVRNMEVSVRLFDTNGNGHSVSMAAKLTGNSLGGGANGVFRKLR